MTPRRVMQMAMTMMRRRMTVMMRMMRMM